MIIYWNRGYPIFRQPDLSQQVVNKNGRERPIPIRVPASKLITSPVEYELMLIPSLMTISYSLGHRYPAW